MVPTTLWGLLRGTVNDTGVARPWQHSLPVDEEVLLLVGGPTQGDAVQKAVWVWGCPGSKMWRG